MAEFLRMSVLDDPLALLVGVSDLEFLTIGGTQYLYVASEALGGVTSYALSGTGTASYVDTLSYSGAHGTLGLNHISLVEIDGQPVLLPSGSYDNRLVIHELGTDGSFDGFRYLGASTDYIGNIDVTTVLNVAGKTFMIGSQLDQSGFRSFEIRDDLSLNHKRHFEDTPTTFVDDITDLGSGKLMGRTFFFASSGFDDGVSSYWIGRWGNVKPADSIGPDSGLWVDAPRAMAVVEMADQLFLVLGSAGSGSLSVIEVNPWGGLFVRDHHLDSLDTRFAGVSAVESVSMGDRHFILAGGSDDGLSLFEISADGRLHHLRSIADQLDTTLTNVSSISATVVGTTVHVFAAGSDAGVTHFTLDLGNLGAAVVGTDFSETLTGTGADDLLVGMEGDDLLVGGGGDDRLIDGRGVDTMTGGAGVDTFVFTLDNRLDTVTDFDPNMDVLDLSALPMIYDMSRLSLTQKAYGVLIEYGDERFRIETEGGQLLISDLEEDNFIF